MKKNKSIIVSILACLLLTSCASAQTNTASAVTKEKIFVKTIHDFEGLRVDNLDESESTNFVVYAEHAKEISLSSEQNTLVEVDEDNLTYTFDQADNSLKELQKGDVIWFDYPTEIPQAAAVKVKDIDINGDMVIIQGDEDIELSDIFEYVDVDMEVGISQFYLTELEEGVALEYVSLDDEENVSGGFEEGTKEVFDEGNTLQSSEENALAGTVEPSLAGNSFGALEDGVKVDIPMGLKLTMNINLGNDTVKGSADIFETIESFNVEFRYSAKDNFFYSSITQTSNTGFSLNVKGKLDGWNKKVQLGEGTVVPIGCPLIAGKIKIYYKIDIAGNISGQISSTQKKVQGFGASVGRGQEAQFHKIEKNEQPVVTAKLTDLSATLQTGPECELSLGIYMIPGIKELAKVYGTGFCGIELKGVYSPTNVTPGADAPSIHDCDICIDGELNHITKITAGVAFGITKEIDQSANPLGVSVTLAERKIPLDEFYLSLKREGIEGAEFGWGNCPHLLYRVDVSVMNTDDGYLRDANVFAKLSDGREKETKTGEDGKAKLYLPPGDNLLTATKDGEKGNAHAVIGEEPIEVIIRLEEVRELFIVYEDQHAKYNELIYPTDQEPDILQAYVERYPGAILVKKSEWDSYEARKNGIVGRGDIILDLVEKTFEEKSWVCVNQFYNGNDGVYEINYQSIAYDVHVSIVLGDDDNETSDHVMYRVFDGIYLDSERRTFGSYNTDYVTGAELDLWEVQCETGTYDEAFYLYEHAYSGDHIDRNRREVIWEGDMLEYDFWNLGEYEKLKEILKQYVWDNTTSWIDKLAEDDFENIVVAE